MRVFAISDIHTDFEDNLSWLRSLCMKAEYQDDAIIIAGDVSDRLPILHETFLLLTQAFAHVFFCFGNHDLWLRTDAAEYSDSIAKHRKIIELCDELGVNTRAKCVDNAVWIVPLLSWHHQSWDAEPDILHPDMPSVDAFSSDYRHTKWPDGLKCGTVELAEYIDQLNDETPLPDFGDLPVISFSHFLPFQDLLPEKRMLFFPQLAKMVGSTPLQRRLTKLKPHVHVFGHTHFGWDSKISLEDGSEIRFIQAPLAYPREQQTKMNGGIDRLPVCIFKSSSSSSGSGDDAAAAASGTFLDFPQAHHWSDHYRQVKRDPSNLQMAPWVAARYRPL